MRLFFYLGILPLCAGKRALHNAELHMLFVEIVAELLRRLGGGDDAVTGTGYVGLSLATLLALHNKVVAV